MNVLGDTFGVGIVEHFSRKQLGAYPPKPLLQQQQEATDSNQSSNELFHREASRSPDYGAATPPDSGGATPKLQNVATPDWSVSSLDFGGRHMEGAGPSSPSAGSEKDHTSNHRQKHLSGSSFGSQEAIREESNL